MEGERDATRRRYPRVSVLGRIDGQVLALDARLTLRDLSLGGFSAEADRPFTPSAQHTFRFTTSDGATIELEAVAVHCRIGAVSDQNRLTYVTGFAWAERPGAPERIAELLRRLALPL